ncbi:hypothetical protein EIP91_009665 [Steccherinum ochraceum]|uniref:Uncharacterized protein n=1 Tax=Steccherinum ochraceum TaxID=92696 RepID=A0A4R0R412_9APHY|nr:hypothetical protein EIP91_009665 [Steccherinum ochraceum]
MTGLGVNTRRDPIRLAVPPDNDVAITLIVQQLGNTSVPLSAQPQDGHQTSPARRPAMPDNGAVGSPVIPLQDPIVSPGFVGRHGKPVLSDGARCSVEQRVIAAPSARPLSRAVSVTLSSPASRPSSVSDIATGITYTDGIPRATGVATYDFNLDPPGNVADADIETRSDEEEVWNDASMSVITTPPDNVPDTAFPPEEPQSNEYMEPFDPDVDRWYVVTIGRRTGIVSDWRIAASMRPVVNEPTNTHYDTYAQACRAYYAAKADGVVKSLIE